MEHFYKIIEFFGQQEKKLKIQLEDDNLELTIQNNENVTENIFIISKEVLMSIASNYTNIAQEITKQVMDANEKNRLLDQENYKNMTQNLYDLQDQIKTKNAIIEELHAASKHEECRYNDLEKEKILMQSKLATFESKINTLENVCGEYERKTKILFNVIDHIL